MTTKAVFFDQDGTLVDSLPGIELSVDHALAKAQLPARELRLGPLIGPPIRQIFSQLVSQADEQQLSRLEAAFRASYDSVGWRETRLHDNAALILAELSSAGVQLFLVTNKPTFATDRILEALNIRHFFREVLCRDKRTPPFESKAEMLKALTQLYNLEPTECLYVGDTYEDYRAGLEAGMQTAIVMHGNHKFDGEHKCPEAIILKHFTDFLEIIEIKETA